MLLFRNAKQVVQVARNGQPFLKGKEAMNNIAVIEGGGSVLVNRQGRIEAVGTVADVDAYLSSQIAAADKAAVKTVDCTGKVLLPGFVDAHTHPVWAGDRSHEFMLKLNGASYLEVQQAGGGIGFTTSETRKASEAELLRLLVERLDRMLSFGSTTIEGKSGYGLNTESELKLLRVLKQADEKHAIDIVATFCGAHAVPQGSTAEEATKDVIETQLPAVMKELKEGKNNVRNIDVFLELGVFTREQAREILLAGKRENLALNFHGDELSVTHSGELAAELGATAVAHLEHVTSEGIASMAAKDVVAVLLPMTAYVLRIAPPPARALIDGGGIVALGSDFCPNAHSMSMPHTMNVACILMNMTVQEALTASTINAAASLKVSDVCGSLEKGKLADIVVLDAPRWEHIVYQMVDPPIVQVYKKGVLVYEKADNH